MGISYTSFIGFIYGLPALLLIKHLEQWLTRKYTFSVCYHQHLSSQVSILGGAVWPGPKENKPVIVSTILFIYLFIYFGLRWVFLAAHRLSLAVVSGGYSLLPCVGSSLQWLLLLQSTGSRSCGLSSYSTQAWLP